MLAAYLNTVHQDSKNNVSPKLFALLKGTSRSLYISLRFLPQRIRPTIAVAYLLARASDTIADTNEIAPVVRRQTLAEFEHQMMIGGVDLDLTGCMAAEGMEKVLLTEVPLIFTALQQLSASHRELVVEVLQKIIRGQTLDIERFELQKGVQALSDAAALDEYIYLVAGSVGEFWTKLCRLEWPSYSKIPDTELLRLGANFGKGLQLINIIRDFPVDLHSGRSYLPIPNPEAVAADPEMARADWERFRIQALQYLEEAWRYVTGIRPPRVRFACAVPLFIGIRTLYLLAQEPQIRPGIKVSRAEVRKLMLLAAFAAWFPFLESRIYRTIVR